MNKRQATKEILASTKSKEATLYKVNFQTKEFSVHSKNEVQVSVPQEIKQEYIKTGTGSSIPRNKEMDMSSLRHKLETKKETPKLSSFKYELMYLLAIALFLFSFNSEARGPEGEYSALVEQNLKREDFKDKKEMKKFVDSRSIEISHELNDNREVVELRTIKEDKKQ